MADVRWDDAERSSRASTDKREKEVVEEQFPTMRCSGAGRRREDKSLSRFISA